MPHTFLITTDYSDLYQFLHALVLTANQDAASSYPQPVAIHNSIFNSSTTSEKTVMIWSPQPSSDLLDSPLKVELVQTYARKLGVEIALCAIKDQKLRQWGREAGWQDLWEMPVLDEAFYPLEPTLVQTSNDADSSWQLDKVS